MAPEFCDRLLGIGCLGNHEHVRLRTDDHSQSCTNDRMVFDAQNSNDVAPGHHGASVSIAASSAR
jgi:hypothetical protein